MEVASKKLGDCGSRIGCGELENDDQASEEQKANFLWVRKDCAFQFLRLLVSITQFLSMPGPITVPALFRQPSGVPCKLPIVGRLESLGFLWQQGISQAVLFSFIDKDSWSH